MINILKRFFVFYYHSPLAIDDCEARFNDECRHALIETERSFKKNLVGLPYHISNKKGITWINVSWFPLVFKYGFMFKPCNSTTVLRCTHNPFSFFALGPVAFLATMFYSILLFKVIESSSNFFAVTIFSIIILIGLCAFLGAIASFFHYFSKERVTKTLYYLLLAVPVTDKKCRDEFESLFRASRERKT